MRIIVISQPASWHAKLRALLRQIYGLKDLNHDLVELPGNADEFQKSVGTRKLPDNSILSHHYPPTRGLIDSLESIDCHIVFCIRDPYDAFESLYLNANSKGGIPLVASTRALKNIPLDNQKVLEFIRSTYGDYLKSSLLWMESRKALVIRYEELIRNTKDVLKQLCGFILGVSDEQITSSLSNSGLETRINEYHTQTRLNACHLWEINDNFASIVEAMGYKTRKDQDGELVSKRLQDFALFIQELSEEERFFIVGRGKSGTTWLYMTFFHHPHCAMVAERKLIERPDRSAALLQPLLDNDWFSNSSFGVSAPEQKNVRYELGRVLSDYLLYRAHAIRTDGSGLIRNTPISHVGEKIALNT